MSVTTIRSAGDQLSMGPMGVADQSNSRILWDISPSSFSQWPAATVSVFGAALSDGDGTVGLCCSPKQPGPSELLLFFDFKRHLIHSTLRLLYCKGAS
jgi:hypothetical protein